MTDHADATLATLRATIRRLALPASFALQPAPDWDALIAEQDAIEAAQQHAPVRRQTYLEWLGSLSPENYQAHLRDLAQAAGNAPPTAAAPMPASALRHARRTGWEEVR